MREKGGGHLHVLKMPNNREMHKDTQEQGDKVKGKKESWVRDRWTENNTSVTKNRPDKEQSRDRQKSGKGRTEEKAGNRKTAGTLGHAGWIEPC